MTKKSKLQLKTETLRTLSQRELQSAAGGVFTLYCQTPTQLKSCYPGTPTLQASCYLCGG